MKLVTLKLIGIQWKFANEVVAFVIDGWAKESAWFRIEWHVGASDAIDASSTASSPASSSAPAATSSSSADPAAVQLKALRLLSPPRRSSETYLFHFELIKFLYAGLRVA